MGVDLGLPITGDLLPFMVFALSHGFLGISGVLQADIFGVFESPSSDLWSGSGDEPFSAILLLLASKALISSIRPPPPGRCPFPLASVLAPDKEAAKAAPASSLRGTFRSLAPARAAASPESGRSSVGLNSPAGRGGAGGGGGTPGGGGGPGGTGATPGDRVGGSGGGGGGGGCPGGTVVVDGEVTVEPGGSGGGGGGVGALRPGVESWGLDGAPRG